MKKIIVLIAILSAPVMAGELASCDQLGGTAERIMKHRQDNGSMSQIMALVNQHAPSLSGLVLAAYKEPLFSTYAYKQTAIAEFRNDVELACYEGRK